MKTLLAFVLLTVLSHPASAQVMTLYGQMHHTSIEGGCWYLQTNDGKSYELIGDTSLVYPLHVDGERVGVQVERAKAGASVCMIGEIVRVIKRVDSIRYAEDPLVMPLLIDGKMYRAKSGSWYVKTSKGNEYTFQKPPEKKYRHVGAHFHQKARVIMDPSTKKKYMDGVIIPDDPMPKQKKRNIPKYYDPR